MKTLEDYTVVMQPDDGTLFAWIPAIPGCYTVGDTSEEARRELEGVFAVFRDDYAEHGEHMPEDVRELVAVAS